MKLKTLLFIAVIAFTNKINAKAQNLSKNNAILTNLQAAFNSRVALVIKEYKLDWSTAIRLSDEVIHNILDKDFRTAEYAFRSKDTKSLMTQIDSCIQFEVIKNALTTCPELASAKVNDFAALTKNIQEHRRKTKTSKIGLNAIKTGAALYFGSIILNNNVNDLNVFFNDNTYFLSKRDELRNLMSTVKGKNLTFFPVESSEGNYCIMTCSFLENNKTPRAQVKLMYSKNDFFGKIDSITFVPIEQIKFNNENTGAIAIDKF